MSLLDSPFIVNMHNAFQDDTYLYMITDLMEGKDLRKHLTYNEIHNL